MKMRIFPWNILLVLTVLSCLLAPVPGVAGDGPQILFTNVSIFDGLRNKLTPGNVLVEDNLIREVSSKAIDAPWRWRVRT